MYLFQKGDYVWTKVPGGWWPGQVVENKYKTVDIRYISEGENEM